MTEGKSQPRFSAVEEEKKKKICADIYPKKKAKKFLNSIKIRNSIVAEENSDNWTHSP